MRAMTMLLTETNPQHDNALLLSPDVFQNFSKQPMLTIVTLQNVKDHPECPRKMFELVREGVLDTPGHAGGFEDYKEFVTKIYDRSYLSHASTQFLALREGELIGLSSVTIESQGTAATFGLTTVRRTERRQGIAKALKLSALDTCLKLGVQVISTEVHETNLPMIELNWQLGFRFED